MNRTKFRPVSRPERGRIALWLLAVCEDGAIRGNVAHSGVWAQVMDRLIAHGLVAVVEEHRYEWLDGLRTTEAGAQVDHLIAEAVWAW